MRLPWNALAAAMIALAVAGCRGSQPQVTGFMDVPFGASMKRLTQTVGNPASVTAWPGGASSVTFAQRDVLDEPAEPHFVVTRDGVIQGGYTVYVVGFPSRCQEVYHRFVDAVRTRFPKLKPKEEHEGVDQPTFCEAAAEGRAAASTAWEDPANGARVLVTIDRGEPFVRVTYQSRKAREWSRATNDSMLKKNF